MFSHSVVCRACTEEGALAQICLLYFESVYIIVVCNTHNAT